MFCCISFVKGDSGHSSLFVTILSCNRLAFVTLINTSKVSNVTLVRCDKWHNVSWHQATFDRFPCHLVSLVTDVVEIVEDLIMYW